MNYMTMLQSRFLSLGRTTVHSIVGLTLIALALVGGCSSDSPTESTGPITITVTPTSGIPLTTVSVAGIDASHINDTSVVALFGGELAPIFTDTSGIVTLTVPAVYDSVVGWAVDSVSLSLAFVNIFTGDTIAFGDDLFFVEILPSAPGTAAQLQADLQRISTALGSLSSSFQSGPGIEEMFHSAAIHALDSLISGSDTLAFAGALTRLQNDDPDALLLLDALFAASGVDEQTSRYADIFETMTDSITIMAGKRLLGSTVLTDEELAYRMQLYVVVLEFGRTVVGPTASTYGSVTGPIGLFVSIPAVAITGSILSMADFIVNKLVVAMLPAKIDSISLKFVDDTIILGNTTDATMKVYAVNDPPGITVQDIIGVILNGIGYVNTLQGADHVIRMQDLASLKSVLENVANYLLGLYRSGLSSYASSHSELNLDPSVGSVPIMTWNAEIEQLKFMELVSFTQTIIMPDAAEPNWVSLGPDWGEARVYARTTVDPAAIVIPQPPGFAYSGGAFGEQVERTETKSVWVKPNLVIELTMPPSVDTITFVPMVIRAGYESIAPVPQRSPGAIWSPDVNLTLSASGGTVQLVTGVTDANGEFTTNVRLSAGQQQITVSVDGTGDVGSNASAQGTSVVAGAPVPIIANSQAELNSYEGVVDATDIWLGRNTSSSNDISSLAILYALKTVLRGGEFVSTGTQLTDFSSLPSGVAVTGSARLEAVTITDNGSLSTLTGLEWIKSTSRLTIEDNSNLSLFTGLSGLTNVGTLDLNRLPSLNNLSGMPLLDTVGNLIIVNSMGIDNFAGFPNISFLRSLRICCSDEMNDFAGFPSSITQTGKVDISSLRWVNSLTGLEDISEVTGDVKISNMERLTDLDGLSGLQACGYLSINTCDKLTTLSGLSSLSTINGALIVTACDGLDSTEVANWAAGITITGSVIINP